ncbi:hypothetical protein [Candidatus Tisiphia endosymbiont of Beris chalybata]|uniref:hypothetical protein n=1 Tax=Candidatus Tisiphia endosymbiont of Beris chalybata TaxID=3066262 RepID=UPI00312C8F25
MAKSGETTEEATMKQTRKGTRLKLSLEFKNLDPSTVNSTINSRDDRYGEALKNLVLEGYLSIRLEMVVWIDFDGTMVTGNLTSQLEQEFIFTPIGCGIAVNGALLLGRKEPGYEPSDIAKRTVEILTASNSRIKIHEPEMQKEFLKYCLSCLEKCQIIIHTLSKYPAAVTATLRILELDEEQIKKIVIISGMEDKGVEGNTGHIWIGESVEGKTGHIWIGERLCPTKNKGKNIFVDDDANNIEAAEKQGFQIVKAGKGRNWVPEALDKVKATGQTIDLPNDTLSTEDKEGLDAGLSELPCKKFKDSDEMSMEQSGSSINQTAAEDRIEPSSSLLTGMADNLINADYSPDCESSIIGDYIEGS